MSQLAQQRCVVCGQLDVFPELRCSHCGFLRASLDLCPEVEADLPAAYRAPRPPRLTPPPVPPAPPTPPAPPVSAAASPAPTPTTGADERRDLDRLLLDAALQRVGALAARVRASERLSAEDRAELYESLLTSLLKIERQGLREGAIALEREGARQRHLRQMALIGVSGWLLGILFYFALQSL